jgi:hypothetical protein
LGLLRSLIVGSGFWFIGEPRPPLEVCKSCTLRSLDGRSRIGTDHLIVDFRAFNTDGAYRSNGKFFKKREKINYWEVGSMSWVRVTIAGGPTAYLNLGLATRWSGTRGQTSQNHFEKDPSPLHLKYLARVLEDGKAAFVLQMLVQAYAVPALPQDAGERRLADLDWLPAYVGAVQLQQVERIQERLRLVLTVAQNMEGSHAPLVAAHDLFVNQAGANPEMVHGFDHPREAVGPVIAAPAQQPDANRIAASHQPITVVLDFVNPVCARMGACRRARAGRVR